MILFVFGTTGELIKIAPVVRELEHRVPIGLLCTGQQPTQIPRVLGEFGLESVPLSWLADGVCGRDLAKASDIPRWLASTATSYLTKQIRVRRGRCDAVVVHGDTITTVLGALAGRAARVPVAHVEAGLRSGSWRDPFPEELDRRAVGRLASVHYAPGPWAVENLRSARTRGSIVDTGANTLADAIRLALGDASASVPTEDSPGVVSIHRFEFLGNREAVQAFVYALRESPRPLIFIDHPVTVEALRRFALDAALVAPTIRRVPRLPYVEFTRLLGSARLLITDSGGGQEECTVLGVPCLIHRRRTERQDGLGSIAQLSYMDPAAVAGFLRQPPRRRPMLYPSTSPSAVIADDLVARFSA